MDYLDARRCIDCDDDVRTKKAFWGCEICGLNTCEECCENDGGHVMCGGCVENMTTCYGCDEWFDNDDLRGICQREDCKIHQWDDGCSDHRVLCKDCYVNNNPATEEHEEETHDCNQCSYSLTSKEFYAGKGRIMFSEGDGIKEGEYKCDECHKKKKKKKKRKRLVIVDKLCKVCGEELDDDSDNIDGHLCVECDREENGGTLFAESNPNGLLRCKNCKKNDNFFAMDDPELCVPCVDLLYYCNK